MVSVLANSQLGDTSLPEEEPAAFTDTAKLDEELLQKLHHVLLEVSYHSISFALRTIAKVDFPLPCSCTSKTAPWSALAVHMSTTSRQASQIW